MEKGKVNSEIAVEATPDKTNEQLKEEKKQEEEFVQKLQLIQYKVYKNPELYTIEVGKLVELFKNLFVIAKENPLQKNRKFAELAVFLARVAHFYKYDMVFLPEYLQQLLDSYFKMMNPYLRKKLVASYMIMRSKNLITPIKSITFLFRLFNCQDKELRRMLASHIVNDIKRMNKHHKNNQINKQIQNFIFEVLKKNTDTLARKALQIMIQMYKKNYWNDSKTINIIASGCFNEYYKVQLTACYFLYETTETPEIDLSSDEEEEGQVGVPLDKKNFSKKTKSKDARRERDKKRQKRKLAKKMKQLHSQNFFPIDQIFNPQDFCEKLFGVLKKSNEKFQVKLAIMQVLSRMTGRHKLILLSYYSYLQKYLTPQQKEVQKILAFLAEATHNLIHPDDMQPIIKHIIDNFVNDRCSEQAMTLGLNTLREMCSKNRFLLEADSLNYLVQYNNYKNRNVSKAAKSLINLYRMINPKLLDKKYRGRDYRGIKGIDGEDGQEEFLKFGQEIVHETIDGANLIDLGDGQLPIYMDKILTDEDFRKIRFLQKKKQEEEQAQLMKQFENDDIEDENEEEENDSEIDDEEEELQDDQKSGSEGESIEDQEEDEHLKQQKEKKIKINQDNIYQKIRGLSDDDENSDNNEEEESDYEDVSDDDDVELDSKQEKNNKEQADKKTSNGKNQENQQDNSDDYTDLSELEIDENTDSELEEYDDDDNEVQEKNNEEAKSENIEDEKQKETKNDNDNNKQTDANKNSKKLKQQNRKRRQRELDEQLEGYSSYEEEDEDDQNPHGFISPGMIGYFRKTKSEKKRELKEQMLNQPKEKKYHGPKQKGGGTNDKEKQKNKPLQMLRPKKNKLNKLANAIKTNIKDIKNKLGHVKSGKQAKQLKKRKIK